MARDGWAVYYEDAGLGLTMLRRLAGMVGAALLISGGIIAVVGRLGRSWDARIAVEGHSMEPTLLSGDWLLVDPDAFARRAPRIGELVVAMDPRRSNRVLVKRVQAATNDGALTLTGDHHAHGDDASAIGGVATERVIGRPWFRYWPLERAGRVS